jgi:hypothetical protein
MSKLGLNKPKFAPRFLTLAGMLTVACKTAPETAPPGARAPTTAVAPLPPSSTNALSTPPPSAAAGSPRTYDAATTSIEAAVGETFNVAVPSNITVPMKWRLEPPPDPKLLASGGDKYVEEPPPGCPACTGYGGTRVFSFVATGAGTLTLHLALRPLTDANGPAQKEVSVAVTIR